MKKIITFWLFFLLIICNYSFGQNQAVSYPISYQLPVQYLTAVSTPLIGTNVSSSGALFNILTWSIVGGTLSGCQLSIDSSSNNSTWSVGGVIPAQTCTSNGSFVTSLSVLSYVRVNLSTFTVATGTPIIVITLTGTNYTNGGQVFNCSTATYNNNLKTCLDAAKTYVANNNNGTDNAAYIQLPNGYISLPSAPYTLASGMNIIGVPPRVEYVNGTSADLNMIPNGGTWIDCGGVQCFTGNQLRSISLSYLGFKNVCTGSVANCSVFTFGGNGNPGVDGVAWSYFYDLIAIGSITCCKSDMAWVFYNSQHINGQYMTAFDFNVGLNLISQGLEAPMNSVFSDMYTYTYPKSVANGNNTEPGLWLQCLADSGTNTSGLAFTTIIRPQVNSYNGDNTGTNIRMDSTAAGCAVEDIELLDVDAEGPALDQIILNGTVTHNHIRYMGYSGAPSAPTNTIHITTGAGFNTIESEDNNAILKIDNGGNPQNIYLGTYNIITDAGSLKRGQFYFNSSQVGTYNDFGWYAQGLTFGNFASGVLAAEYDGTAAAPVFTDSTGKEGMHFDHNAHTTQLDCNGTECLYASTTSTSVTGNFFMGAAPSGGTLTTTPLCNYTLSTFFSFAPCPIGNVTGGNLTGSDGAVIPSSTAILAGMKASIALTAQNITCSATFATCVTPPIFTIYDCGSSTNCTSPTTIGTCTTVTTNTIVTVAQGALNSTAIASGDLIAIKDTGGSCVSISNAWVTLSY